MRITFVQSEHESLAVGILSSLLKGRGHDVSFVFDTRLFDSMEISNKFLFKLFDITDRLVQEVVDSKPDFVAFSVFTDEYQWALKMARLIRYQIDTPIIFGGVHPTICPEEVIKQDCVDMICVGEGEDALIRLMDDPTNKNIQGIWTKYKHNGIAPLVKDLNTLPFPDKKLFYDKQPSITGSYGVLTARGCPFACTYCASDVINRMFGYGYLRRRSPQNVIDEIVHARETIGYKLKVIAFWDDTFTYDLKWMKEFLPLYKEKIGLPFHCTGYPNGITDEKAKLLKDAGCFRLGMGVQSVAEWVRRDILKRPGTNYQIWSAIKACHDARLKIWVDHILNIPYEREQDEYEALNFYNETRPDIINVFWLVYYPKAKIIDVAKRAGLLNDAMIERINNGETSTACVGQVGGEYSFGERGAVNYAFLFHLMPLLPQRAMRWIIDKRIFLWSWFKPPLILNVIIKCLVRIKLHQVWDSMWFFIITFKRMYQNARLKWLA